MNSIFYEAVNVNKFIKYNGEKVLSNKKQTKKTGWRFKNSIPFE
jgi:hypothetical protein